MNKSQYLAELSQLLIFMTRADRERTLSRYGALFDAAGPEGQEALLAKLGSTTSSAIRLSRVYNAAGDYEDAFLDALEAEFARPEGAASPAGPEAKEASAPEQDAAALIEDDLPDYDLPDLPDLPDAGPGKPEPEGSEAPGDVTDAISTSPSADAPAQDGAGQAPEQEDSTPSAPSADEEEEDADYEELWGKRPRPQAAGTPSRTSGSEREEDAGTPDEEDEEDDAQATEAAPESVPAAPVIPAYTIERTPPLWAGVPLFALAVVVLAVPLAALCLVLIPAFLLPGLAVLLGAFLAAIGGLWCISIIADAAVLFGAALILLGLGLMVLWCGLWLDVAMVTGYIRAARGLSHLTLGKKVSVYA